MKKSLLFLICCTFCIGSLFSQKKMPQKQVAKKQMPQKQKLYTAKCTTLRDDLKSPTAAVDTTPGRNIANNYAMWDNATELTVKFMNSGSQFMRERVMQYSKEWEQYANIKFKFVPDNTPVTNMRILLGEGFGHNSYVGSDANDISQSKQTLNLDTLAFVSYDYYIAEMKRRGIKPNMVDLKKMAATEPVVWNNREMRGVILHEFGHALGLMHEQSYPGAINWNTDTVYNYYKRVQGWDKRKVDNNVLKVANQFYTNGTSYDPKSIMHYSVDAWQTKDGYSLPANYDLSSGDIALISALYPKDKKISVLEVPKVTISNFQKLDVENNSTRQGISMYPSFDLKTNSKLGEVYVVAMLVDENENYVKDNNDSYNWGGYVAAYPKLLLLPNSQVSYNKAGKRDLELFIPYSEIPVESGKKITFSLRVAVHDVANNQLIYVMNRYIDTPVSITK